MSKSIEQLTQEFYKELCGFMANEGCVAPVLKIKPDTVSYFFSNLEFLGTHEFIRSEEFQRHLAQFLKQNAQVSINEQMMMNVKEGSVTRSRAMPTLKEHLEIGKSSGIADAGVDYRGIAAELMKFPQKYFKVDFGPVTESTPEYKGLCDAIKLGVARNIKDSVQVNEMAINSLKILFAHVSKNPDQYFSLNFQDYAGLSDYQRSSFEQIVEKHGRMITEALDRNSSRGGSSYLEEPGRLSRWLHIKNPISMFGELLRRAKVNEKRVKKGKIGPWEERFKVDGRTYPLHDADTLEGLEPAEKVHLGKEYKKRKLVDPLYVILIAAGFLPEIIATGGWLYEKYINKSLPPDTTFLQYVMPGGFTNDQPRVEDYCAKCGQLPLIKQQLEECKANTLTCVEKSLYDECSNNLAICQNSLVECRATVPSASEYSCKELTDALKGEGCELPGKTITLKGKTEYIKEKCDCPPPRACPAVEPRLHIPNGNR